MKCFYLLSNFAYCFFPCASHNILFETPRGMIFQNITTTSRITDHRVENEKAIAIVDNQASHFSPQVRKCSTNQHLFYHSDFKLDAYDTTSVESLWSFEETMEEDSGQSDTRIRNMVRNSRATVPHAAEEIDDSIDPRNTEQSTELLQNYGFLPIQS